jgi:hypothetical protein
VVLNPVIFAVIRYVPIGRFSKRYSPEPPVFVDVLALVAAFVAVTSAFVTAAPDESVTVPTTLPLIAWPYAIPALSASKPTSDSTNAKNPNLWIPCFIIIFS